MKKQMILSSILICIVLLTGCADRPNTNENESQTIKDSQISDIGNKSNIPSGSVSPEPEIMPSEIDSTIEHSFLGTVLEETTSYMIVEPDETEEERQLSDRLTVTYPSDHYDYLYGEGRRVVIYYYETPALRSDFEIITEDISTEGFREFELSIKPSENSDNSENNEQQKTLIRDGLYYYGISDVSIRVDDETMPLTEALETGKVTLNALISRANRDVRDGTAKELSYDDGGSSLYQYSDYSIIKYHTLDGNRDVYIGSRDMDINVHLQ